MKNKLINETIGMIEVIEESPELFHDGIDEEIIDLLKKIINYLIKKGE